MAYDPKRPRPAAAADEPAPVEALLADDEPSGDVAPAAPDPVAAATEQDVPAVDEEVADEATVDEVVAGDAVTDEVTADEVTAPSAGSVSESGEDVVDLTAGEPARDDVLGRTVPGATSNGSGTRPAPEVPVAPAPEEGTTNRAVLAAVLGGSVLVAILLLLWRRRRGASD